MPSDHINLFAGVVVPEYAHEYDDMLFLTSLST